MRAPVELENQVQMMGMVPTVETRFVPLSPWRIAAARAILTPDTGRGFLIPD